MYKSLRRPERLFRFGQWLVALLFAYFLVQVGAHLIADLPSIYAPPKYEDFVDQKALEPLEQVVQPAQERMRGQQRDSEALRTQLHELEYRYQQDKENFDNWRAARSSTEQSDQNPEVLAKVRVLEQQLQQQQQLQAQIYALQQERRQLAQSIAPQSEAIRQLHQQAQQQYQEAIYQASLKAFGVRLVFVGPLLLLAIWLFRRHRNGQNWPFVWGFIFFALFAFFFELVPYLPSFGGYVRYGVGAVLTFLGGRALIRSLQEYLERKRHEQQAPQEERQQEIRYEQALTAIGRNQCPSCERTLLAVEGAQVNYCMHCGLKLYDQCPKCGLRHNAFFPFCPACGAASDSQNKPSQV